MAPRFGLFTLSPQAVSVDKTVTFDYFKVNGYARAAAAPRTPAR